MPELASWTLKNFGGCPKCLKWSSQSRPMTGFVASQGTERAPPHDLLASWQYRRYLMGLWHVWLPPCCRGCQRVWRPVPACGNLWRAVGTDWMPLYKSLEPSMPGGLRLRCPDATLAGLAGWLAWLAGCSWRVAAGWLLLADGR